MRRNISELPFLVGLGLVAGGTLVLPFALGAFGDAVRMGIGLPFVLILPGYVITRALFPRGSEPGVKSVPTPVVSCTPIERFGWTIGLSMALTALGALLLNMLPGGLGRTSWVLFLIASMMLAGMVGWLRERTLDPPPTRSRVLLSRRQLAVAGAAVLVAGGALWVGKNSESAMPQPGFSQLWLESDDTSPNIVGPSGVVGTTSGSGLLGAATVLPAQLGVHSYEDGTRRFRLELLNDGTVVRVWSFSLPSGDEWRQPISVPRGVAADAVLYRDGDPAPYRHVWLRSS
jgi:hypothetical protein